MATIYEYIEENKRRTVLLVLLFPLVFMLLALATAALVVIFSDTSELGLSPMLWQGVELSQKQTLFFYVAFFLGPVCWVIAMLWIFISYFVGDKMMLMGVGAVEISRRDQPEIYRLVENLCITRGLPVPRIYVLDDDSLNAFATGRDPQHASIALTKGIVKKLERAELEGVIAHELAHVENRDIRLMLLTVAGISFFTFAGEWLLRAGTSSSRGSSRKGGGSGIIALVGLMCLIYGYLLAPLLRLAVSRQREYQADATAALTTRNPRALASALHKISSDSRVEVLDKRESMAAMCIANPLAKAGIFSKLSGLLATHPPIQKRIAVLLDMDGTSYDTRL